MVIRKLPTKSDKELRKVLKQSVEYAKKAVTYDINDSESWYVLGNAHLTNFFMGGQKYENLDFALKAYTQAEKHQIYQNPDLYYNRATIYNYLERYSDAIADYETAHSIDSNLGARDKARGIQEFILNVCKLISKKGQLKTNKFVSLVKSVPTSIGEVKFMKAKLEEAKHKDSKKDRRASKEEKKLKKEIVKDKEMNNDDVKEESKDENDQKEENKEVEKVKYSVLTLLKCERGINTGGVYIGKLI